MIVTEAFETFAEGEPITTTGTFFTAIAGVPIATGANARGERAAINGATGGGHLEFKPTVPWASLRELWQLNQAYRNLFPVYEDFEGLVVAAYGSAAAFLASVEGRGLQITSAETWFRFDTPDVFTSAIVGSIFGLTYWGTSGGFRGIGISLADPMHDLGLYAQFHVFLDRVDTLTPTSAILTRGQWYRIAVDLPGGNTGSISIETEAGDVVYAQAFADLDPPDPARGMRVRAAVSGANTIPTWMVDDFTVAYLEDSAAKLPAVRLFPRDDGLGLSSAARIFPPPKSRRIAGGHL